MQDARCLKVKPRERAFKQFKSPVLNVLMNLHRSGQIIKNTQKPNFMKIRPLEAELFHAEEQTEARTDRPNEAKSRFSQFCESTWSCNKFPLSLLYHETG